MTFIPFTEKFLIPMFSSIENGVQVKNVGSGPSLALERNFIQLKQRDTRREGKLQLAILLPESILRFNMPTRRKKQNTLR